MLIIPNIYYSPKLGEVPEGQRGKISQPYLVNPQWAEGKNH